MSTAGASAPLRYRLIGRADLGALSLQPFQTRDVERFLGPVESIRSEVRDGVCHVLTILESAGQPLGFFVTHPDRHDASCWWLGYLAVSPTACGRGLGREMLARAIRRLGQVPGCRRIRLLVDPGNLSARRLYAVFGFEVEGLCRLTGELILARRASGAGMSGAGRRSMHRLSLRRRTAAERSPARSCAVWGVVAPGQSPPP